MNIEKSLLLFFVSFFVVLSVFFVFNIERLDEPEPLNNLDPLIENETHTLLFTGDIMLNRGVKKMIEKHGKDYTFPFLKIKETLQNADILFGNLESVISDKGVKIGSIYSFRAEPEAIEGLSCAGFNIVSLANNHAFDYGREAFEDTMSRLKEKQIAYTGGGFNKKEAHSPAILSLGVEELKVGFLGYTEFLYPYAFAEENRSGISVFSKENMKRDIKRARDDVDFLVVTFHYGDEYQKKPNERQVFLSRKAIDYGADIVIGHHPHVTQPVEKYNGKYIAYSLGNFVFDQYFSEETMRGFMLELKIKQGDVVEVNKIHYELNGKYQPEIVKKEKMNESNPS